MSHIHDNAAKLTDGISFTYNSSTLDLELGAPYRVAVQTPNPLGGPDIVTDEPELGLFPNADFIQNAGSGLYGAFGFRQALTSAWNEIRNTIISQEDLDEGGMVTPYVYLEDGTLMELGVV